MKCICYYIVYMGTWSGLPPSHIFNDHKITTYDDNISTSTVHKCV